MSPNKDNKWTKRAKWLGWVIGGAGIGIMIGVAPFISPALRRYCLPYVPATPSQISRVTSILTGPPKCIVDLGSGDGRVVISLAKQGHYVEGIELNFWLVWTSRISALYQGVNKNTRFYWQDLWTVDLQHYDTILFFGVKEMMRSLGHKIEQEVHPGCEVISCRFQFPQWHAIASYEQGANSVWKYKL